MKAVSWPKWFLDIKITINEKNSMKIYKIRLEFIAFTAVHKTFLVFLSNKDNKVLSLSLPIVRILFLL